MYISHQFRLSLVERFRTFYTQNQSSIVAVFIFFVLSRGGELLLLVVCLPHSCSLLVFLRVSLRRRHLTHSLQGPMSSCTGTLNLKSSPPPPSHFPPNFASVSHSSKSRHSSSAPPRLPQLLLIIIKRQQSPCACHIIVLLLASRLASPRLVETTHTHMLTCLMGCSSSSSSNRTPPWCCL